MPTLWARWQAINNSKSFAQKSQGSGHKVGWRTKSVHCAETSEEKCKLTAAIIRCLNLEVIELSKIVPKFRMNDLVRNLCAVQGYDELLQQIQPNAAENGRIFARMKKFMKAECEKPHKVPKLSFEVSNFWFMFKIISRLILVMMKIQSGVVTQWPSRQRNRRKSRRKKLRRRSQYRMTLSLTLSSWVSTRKMLNDCMKAKETGLGWAVAGKYCALNLDASLRFHSVVTLYLNTVEWFTVGAIIHANMTIAIMWPFRQPVTKVTWPGFTRRI